MKWRPIADRILVKVEDSGMTPGGIALPDDAKQKPQRGIAERVGPGIPRQFSQGNEVWPMDVKEGDEILFTHYAGADVGDLPELKGYMLISERDVIAIRDRDGEPK